MQKVLQAATAENDNPDIRDRAYVYWRLLSNTTDPNAAKNVILSQKPPITTTIQSLPPALLDQLLEEMSTLASVYHKPPEQFVGQGRFGADAVQRAAIEYVPFFWLHITFRPMLTHSLGNNSRMLVRTRWPRPLLQQSRDRLLHLKLRATLRTSSTSTLTARPLHRQRAWPAHLCDRLRQRQLHHHQRRRRAATTWTICSACSATAETPPAPAQPPRQATPALAAQREI